MLGSAVWLTLATLLGLCLGFAREWLLVAAWSAGERSDAFLIALFLPEALRMSLAGGVLSAAALPLYLQRKDSERLDWLAVLFPALLLVALLVSLLLMTTALLGWYYALPFVLFLQGMVNSTRFSSMNTLTLKDLPDDLASSGNSLLSMIMQLSMSIGVTIAGLLLGMFGQQHSVIDSGSTHTVFMYTWLCIAFIIALPAIIFARVPNDTQTNAVISRRKRST